MNISRRLVHAAAITVLAVGLGGCSATDPAPTGALETPPASTAPMVTETAIASIEDAFSMPLDPYRAIVSGLASTDAEKVAAQRSRQDELRAQCMREQGFEYFFSPTTAEDVLEELERMADLYPDGWDERGSVAFAEKYGYGLVHGPVIEGEPIGDEEADPVADAETAYLSSLSPSEHEAWEMALYGDMFREPSEDPDPDEWKNRGCIGWADHEVSGGKPRPDDDPAFADLVATLYDTTPTPDNDQATAALEAEWSHCMAAEGFSFAHRQDAAITVEGDFDDLWPRGADGKPEPDGEPSDEQQDRFFTDREYPVAIADATCAEDIDYDARSQANAAAFEERFIEEHRDQLDALALAHGQ